MQNRLNRIWAIPISVLLFIGIYFIPPIHARLAWRLESTRTKIKYLINPPEEAVFQPTQQALVASIVNATMTAIQAHSASEETLTPKLDPTTIPTLTSTPLPASVMLEGVKYESQNGRNNYC